MPRPTLKIGVPTVYNALDDDSYTQQPLNDAGAPSHAGLGRNCSQNDRCHHANLRRTLFNQAFPVNTTPAGYRTAFITGERFGTFQCWGTPGVVQARLYFRAALETSATFTAVPYFDYPQGLKPYVGPIGDGTDPQLIDGGAGAEATYGPYYVEVPSGEYEFGVVLIPDVKSTGPDSTGPVRTGTYTSIRGDSGAFAGFPTAPTRRIIRIVDGAGNEVVGWRDVIGVSSSNIGGAVNDVAEVWPRVRSRHELLFNFGTTWEIKTLYYADIYSLTLTEDPLSGDLTAEFGLSS